MAATSTSYNTWGNNPWSGAATQQPVPDPGFGTLWPGAIGADEHAHTELGLDRPAPQSPPGPNAFLGDLTADDVPSSGWVPDVAEVWENHNVPYPVYDSNAGNQYGPGAISQIHAYGQGASPKFHETQADIGHNVNTRIPNQAMAPSWAWDAQTGMRQKVATEWVAHDQSWDVNGSGIDYRPRFYDVEQPALYNNIISVAQPVRPLDEQYGVSGQTPNMAQNAPNVSVLYQTPPDPNVYLGTEPAQQQGSYITESQGW